MGLALLGGIGVARAQVPPKADGGAAGTPAGRPVLLLPLPQGGYALAQQAGPAGKAPPGLPGMAGQSPMGMQAPMGMHPMMGGPMGAPAMRGQMMNARMKHGWMHRQMGSQGGAIFAFRRGPANIFIRCAAKESMQACVSAASTLIDKVASLGPGGPKHAPPGPTPGAGSGSSGH